MDGTPPIVLGETVLRPRREVSRSLERRPLGRACRRDVRRSEPGTMLGRLAAGPSGRAMAFSDDARAGVRFLSRHRSDLPG
jgi:hypothetical protein